jgi:hypothetical protein
MVAAVVTVATAFFVSGALTPSLASNPVIQTSATLMPFTEWVLVDLDAGAEVLRGVRDGVPIAHVLYQVGLCALVVCVAVLKDARGDQRAHWLRIGSACAVPTVMCAAWAVLGR